MNVVKWDDFKTCLEELNVAVDEAKSTKELVNDFKVAINKIPPNSPEEEALSDLLVDVNNYVADDQIQIVGREGHEDYPKVEVEVKSKAKKEAKAKPKAEKSEKAKEEKPKKEVKPKEEKPKKEPKPKAEKKASGESPIKKFDFMNKAYELIATGPDKKEFMTKMGTFMSEKNPEVYPDVLSTKLRAEAYYAVAIAKVRKKEIPWPDNVPFPFKIMDTEEGREAQKARLAKIREDAKARKEAAKAETAAQ